MNLAYRDIKHNFGRFLLTAIGIGLLLMIVAGMSGIYRGIVEDAILLVDKLGADLWVVQKGTHGPFAEVSRIPKSVSDRVRVAQGVKLSNNFVSFTVHRVLEDGRPLRAVIQGLSYLEDTGSWLPIIAGNEFSQAHFEIIADESLGIALGEKIRLGKDLYTVAGVTKNMLSFSGDGMAFVTLSDAQAIQSEIVAEAIRLEREARFTRAWKDEATASQPALAQRALGPSRAIPVFASPQVSAVIVQVEQGADIEALRQRLDKWPDISVYTDKEQKDFLIKGNIDRAKRQLGLFRLLLVIVSGIIMALIIYTLTIDKVHDIALLKLLGARNRVIFGLIIQQALLLGAIGYVVSYIVGIWLFPKFPRRVIIFTSDFAMLAVAVVIISLLSSLLGIWKAMKIQPNEVLS